MPVGTVLWIAEGMLSDTLTTVEANGDGAPTGSRFTIRNQFLHGTHPLGWIRAARVSLDGSPIPQERLFFEIRGQAIPFGQLPRIRDIWWYQGETASIYMDGTEAAKSGEHAVVCELEISTLAHTPALDTFDIKPRLVATLYQTMRHESTPGQEERS